MSQLSQEELFRRAGLRPVDGRVYAALLPSPQSATVIARKAGMHRPAVYQSLARLRQVGVIVEEKGGRGARYRRAGARQLQALFQKGERAIAKTLKHVETPSEMTLPEHVQFFEGKKALQGILARLLEDTPRNGIFYRFSSRQAAMKVESFMPETYRALRDKKRIQQFVITSAALRQQAYRKRIDCLSKAVPAAEDAFDYGMNILIFGDRVAFVNFITEQAYLIHDSQLAAVQRSIFKQLYARLPS